LAKAVVGCERPARNPSKVAGNYLVFARFGDDRCGSAATLAALDSVPMEDLRDALGTDVKLVPNFSETFS
jgi:hypothetical protein